MKRLIIESLAITGCILLLCVLIVSLVSPVSTTEKSIPYLFVSASDRMQERYSAEEAKMQICTFERITGLIAERTPIVCVYVKKEGDNWTYFISEIIVPGEKDDRPFLELHKRVVSVSKAKLQEIMKECEGGE